MPQPADKSQTLHLAPTMLIGLGGSGKDVLLRIRRLFYERGGALGYPIIGYLALDTDPGSFSRIEDEPVSNFVLQNIQFKRGSGTEVIDCSMKPTTFTQYFSGGAQQHPHVFRWLLPDMNRFGSSAVVEGAGQNRPLGRLAFFHHYRAIRQALEVHLREIISHAKDPNKLGTWKPANAQVDATRLEVILVYSLAGGTGAGMFLDMGMLARIAVAELNLPDVKPHFSHFAVLPEPFVQAPRPSARSVVEHERLQKKIQENAFTALREMEYFSMRQSEARFDLSIPPPAGRGNGTAAPPLYVAQWEHPTASGGKEYRVHDCPWDTCYLVGGKNTAINPDCLPVGEVYQMLAEHIFLDFDPSDFGIKKRSLRSNLHEQTLAAMGIAVKDEAGKDLYHRYTSRRFSTFGLSQIYFDRERMRRAASHRLAWRLVHDWWLRAAGTASELLARAREDIEGGAGGDGRVVTNTHLDGDRPLPLSYDHICRQTCLAEGGEDKAWWDLTRAEAEAKRRQIEEGKLDPMAGEAALAAWQHEHATRLKRSNARAGTEGVALRDFDRHHDRLAPEIESRLRALFLYRVGDLGVPGALHLFKDYAVRAQSHMHEADGVAGSPPPEPEEWKRRLREAQQLPLFSRRAARWELLRAVDAVNEYLAFRYQHASVDRVRASLGLFYQRVSDRVQEGSYAAVLTRFRDLLQAEGGGSTLHYLQQRFEELRRQNDSRKRVIGLLADFDEAEYDRRLNKLLTPSNRPNAPIDWPAIEARVLEELRGAPEGGAQFRDVKSLGQLALALFDLNNPQPLPQAAADEFALRLADACEALVGKFAGDLSALKQFEREKPEQRVFRLSKLCAYSSPYQCRSSVVGMDREVDTAPIVYLGLAEANTSDDERRRFRKSLDDVPQVHADQIRNVQQFSLNDAAVVLYQEKAGIPLCYDAGLEQLGALYDKSDRKRETYLDYAGLNDRLPEIRLVDQEHQKRLALCLQSTLLGIMTGVLAYDPGPRRFKLPMRQAGGGSLVFAVGSRLDEVTQHCARNPEVHRELENQAQVWVDGAVRNSPEQLVALCCAIQYLHEEVRRRVQALIDRDENTAPPSTDAHPLLSILSKRLAPLVVARIQGVPRERLAPALGDGGWEHCPLNWNVVASQAEVFGAEARQQAWDQWKARFTGCFRVLDEEQLPIPVLLPNLALPSANGKP